MSSCGTHKPHSNNNIQRDSELRHKIDVYKELILNHQDSKGFIMTEECDSVLFSSLISEIIPVEIEVAKDQDNSWHRRPVYYENCYPDYSESEISRDMFIGIFRYIWKNKRLDLAEEIFQYGLDNNWIMGKGLISRTYLTPNMRTLLSEIIYRLGGEDHYIYRSLPILYSKTDGFKAHLQVLNILLEGELKKELSKSRIELLKQYAEDNPRNALMTYTYHKYTDGDMSSVIDVLMDETLFPIDRLPTNHDRDTAWLWQREEVEWKPSKEGDSKEYTGGDFLFVANLISN